jgi:spoIIIJ-associated protein
MRTLEQQGKTVDDAISKALTELNVSRDRISVEILEEGSRGLFGLMGARPAKIRVKVAQDASYDAIKEELRSVQPAESQEKSPQKKAVENKANRPSRPQKQQASRGKKRQSQPRAGEGPKDRSKEKERQKESSKKQDEDSASKEQPAESPKTYDEKTIQQITEKAKDALSVILANLQIEYKVEVKRRDDQILMNIHCDNENFLIGRRGTTLDAVQYLVNRIANKDLEEKIQVVLDTSDYRVNRRQRLEKLALRLSRRVKTTGKSVTVAPMNPHDRRIIHLTLQDDSSIRTLSRGTGFMRRIIISSNRSSKQRKSAPPSE